MQADITSSQLQKLLAASGCQLLDVRETFEHAEQHITEAKIIPLGDLEKRASELSKNQPLVIYCRSGKRSTQALTKLKELGFSQAQNLEGGILAWMQAGLPVATGSKKSFLS